MANGWNIRFLNQVRQCSAADAISGAQICHPNVCSYLQFRDRLCIRTRKVQNNCTCLWSAVKFANWSKANGKVIRIVRSTPPVGDLETVCLNSRLPRLRAYPRTYTTSKSHICVSRSVTVLGLVLEDRSARMRLEPSSQERSHGDFA